MLDAYLRSLTQQFPKCCFPAWGSFSLRITTCRVSSRWTLLSSLTRRYGKRAWGGNSPNTALLDISFLWLLKQLGKRPSEPSALQFMQFEIDNSQNGQVGSYHRQFDKFKKSNSCCYSIFGGYIEHWWNSVSTLLERLCNTMQVSYILENEM